MIDQILSQSTAIRPPVLPEVKQKVLEIIPDLESVQVNNTNIKEWLSPIIDLSEYYVYPMNGITEGLNWWYLNEPRTVTMSQGDYQWIEPVQRSKEKIHYVSCPSAINGNFINIPDNIPVALDLAYVGSTKIQKINTTSNIEYVFYSLSKSFGLRNIRTGWLFCKQFDPKLESLVNGAKYYNYYANQISEHIIKHFDVDYVHKTLSSQQENLCEGLDVDKSDSVWLATSSDPKFEKFMRLPGVNRLSLCNFFDIL